MADESEGIDIKLSEEDSPADILRESEDISLFTDDHGSEKVLVDSDLKIDEDLSDSDEDDLKLGMDEIGDLVDEIKLDDQEEEKADSQSDGEEDMVFEDANSQVDGSLELDSALNELGEDEIKEKAIDDSSAGDEGSEESKEDSEIAESDKDNEEEIVAESDDSENIEVLEESESSGESEADSEISEKSESDASTNNEQTKEELGSPDVIDMLHEPELAEESEENESVESEDLDLGMEELDDTVEEDTSNIELEEPESESSEIEDSEIDVLEDLTESDDEKTAQLSEESSDGTEEVNEEKFAAESGDEEESGIENIDGMMPQETNISEESAASLGSKMLLSLHHEAVVEIARTTLTGEEITQITYGSIIELDKAAGEPVELVIEGKTIARGEIVQINNDKLGIRIVGIV